MNASKPLMPLFGALVELFRRALGTLMLTLIVVVVLAQVSGLGLIDFSSSLLQSLNALPLILTSSFYIVVGMIFLMGVGTLTAWHQVFSQRGVWRRFSKLIFIPSIVPVYLYALTLRDGSLIMNASAFGGHGYDYVIRPVLIAFVSMCGNGLWYWWHERMVVFLEQVRREKAAQGVQNLGLPVKQFFILPALKTAALSIPMPLVVLPPSQTLRLPRRSLADSYETQ